MSDSQEKNKHTKSLTASDSEVVRGSKTFFQENKHSLRINMKLVQNILDIIRSDEFGYVNDHYPVIYSWYRWLYYPLKHYASPH